jgi:hypothetical protein
MILRHAVSWPEQGTEAAHRTIIRVLVDRSREKPNVWADSVETAHRAVSGRVAHGSPKCFRVQ